MTDDTVTFVIDGGAARNGFIPARIFVSKLRSFLDTIYALDRAFNNRTQRMFDLEVVGLSRSSPAQVAMKPRATANGYNPNASIAWGLSQLQNIRDGAPVDEAISEPLLTQIIDFATYRETKDAEIAALAVKYEGVTITVDGRLAGQAMVIRSGRIERAAAPWRAGVSRGSIFGELRGVVDVDGEREFYIVPPSGPERVRCAFPENLRQAMVDNLFKVVRAKGMLHYGAQTPFPHLLDADGIEGVDSPEEPFSALAGIFKGSEAPPFDGEIL